MNYDLVENSKSQKNAFIWVLKGSHLVLKWQMFDLGEIWTLIMSLQKKKKIIPPHFFKVKGVFLLKLGKKSYK